MKNLFKTLAFFWTLWYLYNTLSAGSGVGLVAVGSVLFLPWLVGIVLLAVLAWAAS